MSLREKRLQKITEKVIRTSLQKGYIPSSKEFLWALRKEMEETPLSQPSYRFRKVEYGQKGNNETINRQKKQIKEDLDLLYENIVDVHGLLDKQRLDFKNEKERLEKELNALEEQIREKAMMLSKGGWLASLMDSFDDVERVDLASCSNVFVDTEKKAVRLVEEKNESGQFFPTVQAFFKVSDENHIFYPIGGALSDVFQEQKHAYQGMVTRKEKGSLTGIYTFLFDKTYLSNGFSYKGITIKPQGIRAEFTTDGDVWQKIPFYENMETILKEKAYSFPTLEMKGLRFFIEKFEEDETLPSEDGYHERYLFGIEEIRLFGSRYPQQGVFVTKPLKGDKDFPLNTISLSVEETRHLGNDIVYEVGFLNEEGEASWHRIDPLEREDAREKQTIFLNNVSTESGKRLFFPESISPVQYEAEDLAVNGLQFYRWSHTENDVESLYLQTGKRLGLNGRLYIGRDAWEVYEKESDGKEGYPELSDWEVPPSQAKRKFLSLHNRRVGELFSRETNTKPMEYFARLGWFHEGEQRVLKFYPSTNAQSRIYINGEKIFEGKGNGENLFYIQPGWNEIVVLINGKDAPNVNGVSFQLGMNPLKEANKIYGYPTPLKEIPLFDLQYNTKKEDRRYFSMRDMEKGTEILTNFYEIGMIGDLYYEYEEEWIPEKDILLRATFLRNDSEEIPSPILSRYRIQCS